MLDLDSYVSVTQIFGVLQVGKVTLSETTINLFHLPWLQKKTTLSSLCSLNTYLPNADHTTFTKTYLTSIKISIGINHHRGVLDSSIEDTPTTTANNILASLNSIFSNSQEGAGINPANDDELDIDDLDELGAVDECNWMNEDATRPPSVEREYWKKYMT